MWHRQRGRCEGVHFLRRPLPRQLQLVEGGVSSGAARGVHVRVLTELGNVYRRASDTSNARLTQSLRGWSVPQQSNTCSTVSCAPCMSHSMHVSSGVSNSGAIFRPVALPVGNTPAISFHANVLSFALLGDGVSRPGRG